jgi:hypothetical protein
MEINKIQAIVDNKAQWQIWEGYLQELRQQTLQELEVATLERDLFRCQGKLALVRKLLNLPEALKRSKENK